MADCEVLLALVYNQTTLIGKVHRPYGGNNTLPWQQGAGIADIGFSDLSIVYGEIFELSFVQNLSNYSKPILQVPMYNLLKNVSSVELSPFSSLLCK